MEGTAFGRHAAFGLALAAFAFALVVEARAADDGEAPLWQGLGSVVGIVKKDDPTIEYREHGKLVLPPSNAVPPPGAAVKSLAGFPVDVDVQKARKAKALEDGPSTLPKGRNAAPLIKPGEKVTVTTSATSGAGPGGGACLQDGQAVPCPSTGEKASSGPGINWNPLTWVGLQKKPQFVLGPAPDRDFLTDPPKDLREPVEGVGAKVDNN